MKVLRTLLVHYLYTTRDTANYELTDDELMRVAEAYELILGVRWILKEDAE
jgi:hypothetical protein